MNKPTIIKWWHFLSQVICDTVSFTINQPYSLHVMVLAISSHYHFNESFHKKKKNLLENLHIYELYFILKKKLKKIGKLYSNNIMPIHVQIWSGYSIEDQRFYSSLYLTQVPCLELTSVLSLIISIFYKCLFHNSCRAFH